MNKRLLSLTFILAATILAIVVTFLTSCQSPNMSKQRVAAFRVAVSKTPSAGFVAGGNAEKIALDNVKAFLADLSPDNVRAMTRKVYAENAYFNDTLKTLQGVDAIEVYLLHTAETVTSINVEFDDVARSGDDYYLRWRMDFRAPKLSGGEVIRTIGITQIRFNRDGKVVLHQDFWDSAAGLFEHLPVSNQMINAVRKRL